MPPIRWNGEGFVGWGGEPALWGANSIWTPSTTDILDCNGVHKRADRFRFELCDKDLKAIGELHPDRAGSVPSITNDSSDRTSRRLTNLMLTKDEVGDINVLTDRLRVYMVLQNGVEYRLGTFLWGEANNPLRSWGSEQHSELFDYTYILDQQTTRAFGWGRGVTIGIVMFFIVMRAGFEMTDVIKMGDEANRSLPEAKSWEPGATWSQILTDLGDVVGFAPPWFNRDGKMTLDQPPDPRLVHPTVRGYGEGGRVIADSILYSNDLLKAPNDFAVFDSGTNRIRVGRYQIPATAPHSFAKRGFRIGFSKNVQGLANQAAADKAAQNLVRHEGVAYEWLQFNSTADPRHDTYDVVEAFDQTWLEMSWSLELRSGGQMTHMMRRTVYD